MEIKLAVAFSIEKFVAAFLLVFKKVFVSDYDNHFKWNRS